jgi:hypothetical protein
VSVTKTPVSTERASAIQRIPISELQIYPAAQREYDSAQAARIAAKFDIEKMGYPVVSRRGGAYYIVDGQHRIAALKMLGCLNDKVECEVYEDLSEVEEAELFLGRNERRGVRAPDKFRVGITAKRETELEITKIVESCGLYISTTTADGSVRAVQTLRKIYKNFGGEVLRRTLMIIRDAYGSTGFDANVLNGISLVCQRYGDEFTNGFAVDKLSALRGGVNGLLGNANVLRKQTGSPKGVCTAAAVVDIFNGGRGGHKLTPWWASQTRRARG